MLSLLSRMILIIARVMVSRRTGSRFCHSDRKIPRPVWRTVPRSPHMPIYVAGFGRCRSRPFRLVYSIFGAPLLLHPQTVYAAPRKVLDSFVMVRTERHARPVRFGHVRRVAARRPFTAGAAAFRKIIFCVCTLRRRSNCSICLRNVSKSRSMAAVSPPMTTSSVIRHSPIFPPRG